MSRLKISSTAINPGKICVIYSVIVKNAIAYNGKASQLQHCQISLQGAYLNPGIGGVFTFSLYLHIKIYLHSLQILWIGASDPGSSITCKFPEYSIL